MNSCNIVPHKCPPDCPVDPAILAPCLLPGEATQGFWTVSDTGIKFVKHYCGHMLPIVGVSASEDRQPNNMPGLWSFKSQTDLYEFMKVWPMCSSHPHMLFILLMGSFQSKSTPTCIMLSPDLSSFITFSLPDWQIHIFSFLTGKMAKKYDESLRAIQKMQQASTAMYKVKDMEFAETDDEALEVELCIEALLDEIDVRMAAAYKASMWHNLYWGSAQGTTGGGPSWRAQKWHAGADIDGDAHSVHLWKWSKGVFRVGGYLLVPLAAF